LRSVAVVALGPASQHAMGPKRKQSPKQPTPAKSGKKAKAPAEPSSPSAAPAVSSTKAPAKKPLAKMTVAELWSAAAGYVDNGGLTQEGFAKLIEELALEEMSFESIYLTFLLSGSSQTVDDVMVVCSSKAVMQRALDCLGCRLLGDLPGQLRSKSASLQAGYGDAFQAFFRWLFEMGKAIAALNNGVQAGAVRTVPLQEGVMLMDAVLGSWPLMPQLKAFCQDKFGQPFSKDLWTQVSRFAHMTSTGQISSDLSNYDDDATGGGSAWPCAIDDFVEYVQEQASLRSRE